MKHSHKKSETLFFAQLKQALQRTHQVFDSPAHIRKHFIKVIAETAKQYEEDTDKATDRVFLDGLREPVPFDVLQQVMSKGRKVGGLAEINHRYVFDNHSVIEAIEWAASTSPWLVLHRERTLAPYRVDAHLYLTNRPERGLILEYDESHHDEEKDRIRDAWLRKEYGFETVRIPHGMTWVEAKRRIYPKLTRMLFDL